MQNIENAFVYYLNNYNNGKPIIIASHSQGSLLARRILKKFFDGKPLQNRLIAAYIPGIKILKEDFTEIKLMTNPEQFGGFVSWNTYKRNKLPKNYDLWYKGGVTSNPISWDSQKKIDNELLISVISAIIIFSLITIFFTWLILLYKISLFNIILNAVFAVL